jgi:hypothetical protein
MSGMGGFVMDNFDDNLRYSKCQTTTSQFQKFRFSKNITRNCTFLTNILNLQNKNISWFQ